MLCILFKGFSHRAQGASHIAKNLPCQDNAKHYESSNLGIAVVSDGHGSEKHFRSAIGSKIATEISIQAIKDFIARENDYIDAIVSDVDKILKQLESNIIYRWNEAVYKHLTENPEVTEEEKLLYGDVDLKIGTRVYGATLIAAVITEKYWFVLQIGDGACVTVIDTETAKILVPEDERLVFGFTTSLCDSNAIDNFRHYFHEISEETPMPLGLIVSSDGLVDSYESDVFLGFNCKMLNTFSSQDITSEEIETFLLSISEKGSKDDISVAGIYFKPDDTAC